MLRALILAVAPVIALGVGLGGCSLILDFSDSEGVHDAPPPDAFYTAAECAYDEPNDTIAAPAMVTAADTGPAAICPSASASGPDLDYYAFAVPQGTTTVTVQLMYEMRGTTGDLDLALFDPTTSEIASEDDFATTKTITCPSDGGPVCPALSAGTYTFEVSPAVPANVNDYTFSLQLQ